MVWAVSWCEVGFGGRGDRAAGSGIMPVMTSVWTLGFLSTVVGYLGIFCPQRGFQKEVYIRSLA